MTVPWPRVPARHTIRRVRPFDFNNSLPAKDGAEELSDQGKKNLDTAMGDFLRFTRDNAVMIEGYASAGSISQRIFPWPDYFCATTRTALAENEPV